MTQQNATIAHQKSVKTKITKRLYSLKENWHLLQPYLDDPEVLQVLNECMVDYCDQHSCREWDPANGPWEYTRNATWLIEIIKRIENDHNYREEKNRLRELYGDHIGETDEFIMIWRKYYEKHSPKKSSFEYYQLFHGSHWIAPFIEVLLARAFGVFSYVLGTDTHSVACFISDDDTHYFADLLNDWDSVQDLSDFMESVNPDPMHF